MAIDGVAAKEVLAHIDRDELAQQGCDLTSIPSPTGHEKAIAEFILAWFKANGLKAVRQDVGIDRYSLGFNGHTDTSFTGTRDDLRMAANLEPDDQLRGRIVGFLAAAHNVMEDISRVFEEVRFDRNAVTH